MLEDIPRSQLPIYRNAIDWEWFDREFPAPDVFAKTIFKWPYERVRALQNLRFLAIMEVGWKNAFYQKLWRSHGIERGDICSIDDLGKLPTFNSDDIKSGQTEATPFGTIAGIEPTSELRKQPLKLQTSGGTTGKARPTLYGVVEWELNGLQIARSHYLQGARPGDIIQIPATCSLANLAWSHYHAAHNYLGAMPLTTGSGVVTPSRKQVELAFDYGTTVFVSFPEYLTTLAAEARKGLGRDPRELKLKYITTYLGPDLENSLRNELENLFGCPVYDNYGTHEISHAAFEAEDKNGMYLMEDCIHIDFIDTETGAPVSTGEVGNMVATSLYRHVVPLIRFNLRDLGRLLPHRKTDLGSEFRRIDRFLGRSDSMVKIRGTNVYPMACLNAVKSDGRTTGEWVVFADRHVRDSVIRDELTVQVEVRGDAGNIEGLQDYLEKRLLADLGLKVAVELVDEGALREVANLGREGKPRRLLDRRHLKA
jgi:phenylacetate-CoA ligase